MRELYLSLDEDSDLLNSAIELLEVDLTLVVDVEVLETLCKETLLTLVGRAFL